jgi:hypothetical protein
MNKFLKLLILASFTFTWASCTDWEDETNFGSSDDPLEIAVPLINTKMTVSEINQYLDDSTTMLRIDPDGRVYALYNGEVIRQTANTIFPAYVGLFPFFITDTLVSVKLPFTSNTYLIKNAVFKDTKVKFNFEHSGSENVVVTITIPEISKNGVVFQQTFNMNSSGTAPVVFTSPEFALDGWDFKSVNNALTFHYIAKLPDGRKIKLKNAAMSYDVIKFKYIDGYLGHHTFGIDGSAINVGLFNKWVSGSFNFEDPKIRIEVDNAFGLPVRSRINLMQLTSITGQTVNLESQYINTGIDFAFPSFNEIGQIKTTRFDFDKDNSNIRQLFNEKTKTISYDIDALINPERDTTVKGFITDQNFFVVKVAVEVPLFGSVNSLVVQDTFDIDFELTSDVESAELKFVTTNDFPASVGMQAYMLDASNNSLGSIFGDNELTLQAATLRSDNTTDPGKEIMTLVTFEKDKLEAFRKTRKIRFVGKLNTVDSQNNKSYWVLGRYGIGAKVGAKIKYKKK